MPVEKFDPANAVFVVYHVGSSVENARYSKGSFGAKKAAAKRKAAALNAKALAEAEKALSKSPENKYCVAALEAAKKGAYAVAEMMEYKYEVVYWKKVNNLMNGKPVWEPSNLPYYLSVASNHYWES